MSRQLVELLRQCEVGYTAVAVHAVIIVKVLPLGSLAVKPVLEFVKRPGIQVQVTGTDRTGSQGGERVILSYHLIFLLIGMDED